MELIVPFIFDEDKPLSSAVKEKLSRIEYFRGKARAMILGYTGIYAHGLTITMDRIYSEINDMYQRRYFLRDRPEKGSLLLVVREEDLATYLMVKAERPKALYSEIFGTKTALCLHGKANWLGEESERYTLRSAKDFSTVLFHEIVNPYPDYPEAV